ncbi:MAG: septum formation initiator [Rhodospirillales bacterium CG15_BIG_FIL_POST_REV_8_21_14_020_66_15]|nr:MAG: septum formation initiator [Rhodospirillales bacterium CG15_BIG_FIL_POST_REV_8_21_14_020_66_15]
MATRFASLKKKLAGALGPSLGVLACAYFAYHAVHGERGVTSLVLLQDKVAEAEILADDLKAQREEWEHRVELLSPQALDLDMLEERARLMLNVGFERDYVIFLGRKGN